MFPSWKSCFVLVVVVVVLGAAAGTEPSTLLALSVFVELSPDDKVQFRDHMRPVKPETLFYQSVRHKMAALNSFLSVEESFFNKERNTLRV